MNKYKHYGNKCRYVHSGTMDANSPVIPINSPSVETCGIQEPRAVFCIEDLIPWELFKTTLRCSMDVDCPVILMHFFILPVLLGKKNIRELQECCLRLLCTLEITVLQLLTLPCSERCSETWDVGSKNNGQGVPEMFLNKLKLVLFVLF